VPVRNIHITAQLSVKVFQPDGKILWSSKALSNHGFDDEKRNFYADEFACLLSEDNDCLTIKSAVDPEIMIDLKIKRSGAGFKIGKDGKTTFGTDAENPWGFMQHAFWPKATAEGTIAKVDFAGRAMFVKALQGMKPHHAGKSLETLVLVDGLIGLSCEMELPQLPRSFFFCSHDGLYYPSIIRNTRSLRRWYCKGH
jgi:hypothetical protein